MRGLKIILVSFFCSVVWAASEDETQGSFNSIDSWDSYWRNEPTLSFFSEGGLASLASRGESPTIGTISINDFQLSSPWSGLFSADLPFSPSLVKSSSHGNKRNCVEMKPIDPFMQGYVEGGDLASWRSGVSAKESIGNGMRFGLFAEAVRMDEVDAKANDYENYNVGGQLQQVSDEGQIDFLVAHKHQSFGAQGYYGIPSSVFADEERDDLFALYSWTRGELADSFVRATVGLRQRESRYHIPSLSFFHKIETSQGGLMVQGKTIEVQYISLFSKVDLHHEQLRGDCGEHERTYGSFLVGPQISLDRVRINIGLNSCFYTGYSPDYLPRATISYSLTDNSKLHLGYREESHLPNYRQRYYTDLYHLPDSSIKRQKTDSVQFGYSAYLSAEVDCHAALFYRTTRHASDWVKAQETDVAWTVMDLGSIDALGFESTLNYRPSNDLSLQLFYQWVNKDKTPFYASLYAMDYSKYLLKAVVQWNISSSTELIVQQALRYQTEHNLRGGSRFSPEASIGVQYRPSYCKNLRFSCTIDNLWESDFEQMPNIPARPRTFSAALTVGW